MNDLTLKNFFTVLKCPSCGEPFELGNEGNGVLCDACRKKWEDCKNTVCSECGNIATVCRCMPPLMKSSGASVLLKLGFYESNSTVIQKIVLYMKDYRDKRVFDHVSLELSLLLEQYFNEKNINAWDVIFTFSPRSRKNYNKSGFDQAAELSKRCAKYFGAVFAPLIKRKYISKNQKGLDHNARLKNARGAFVPNSAFCVNGKNVVLIDDVITTGASLSECVKCIKTLGAKKVICIAVTKTFGNKKI